MCDLNGRRALELLPRLLSFVACLPSHTDDHACTLDADKHAALTRMCTFTLFNFVGVN